MPDELSAEQQAAADELQAEQELNSGFENATPPAKTTEAEPNPAVVSEPKPTTVEPSLEAKQGDFAITKEQWDALEARLKNADNLDKRIKDTVNGSLGAFEDRIVKKLQVATPQGMTVELPPDVFAEMKKDFPELAGQMETVLTKTLKGIRGTGPAAATPPDADAIEKMVRQRVQAAEAEALADVHPDWKAIVGAVNLAAGEQPDPNNPYRAWLAKQPEAYQTVIAETDSASVIARSIDRFKTETKAPKKAAEPEPRAAARKDLLKRAIQPKGDGGQPQPGNTAEDEFQAGFKTG